MAKDLKTILAGVKSSKKEKMDLSDWEKSKDGQAFAGNHEIEKHADRVGNRDDVYKGKTKQVDMKNHGYKAPADQKVYEASKMKCESCNKMYEGSYCESCGDKSVPKAGVSKRGLLTDKKKLYENAEQIDELEKETMKSYVKKAGADKRDSEMKSKVYGSLANTLDSQSPKEASEVRAKGHEYYANAKKRGEGIKLAKKKLDEVLTKKTSASKVIDDFVHSDNKMFKGDSKEQRIRRALGAYYSMHKEEAVQIDELSKDAVGDYIKSGSSSAANLKTDAAYANMTGDDARANKNRDKARNRQAGIYTAVNKLTGRARVNANEEADFEFEMARNELATAERAISRLMPHLKGEGQLEAWVQSKITKGSDYLDTVADYMDSLKEEAELDEVSIVGKSKVSNFAFSKKSKENRAEFIAKQRASYDPVEKKKAEVKAKNLAMLKAVSAKQKTNEDFAMPMLEGGKKKKSKPKKEEKESAPSDGQVDLTSGNYPSGNVGDTGRV